MKIYMGELVHCGNNENQFRAFWNKDSAEWRLNNPRGKYFKSNGSVFSKTHLPFFNTLLTSNPVFGDSKLKKGGFNVLKMSIGLNTDVPSLAFNLPEFLKPSPLNLIFKDLSTLGLIVSSENCYFELIDFDAY